VERAHPPEEWPGSRPGPWREAEWEREKAAATLVSSGNGRERRERQGGGVGCNCNAGLVEAATIGGRKLRPEFDKRRRVPAVRSREGQDLHWATELCGPDANARGGQVSLNGPPNSPAASLFLSSPKFLARRCSPFLGEGVFQPCRPPRWWEAASRWGTACSRATRPPVRRR
jgi:hypothetical protein